MFAALHALVEKRIASAEAEGQFRDLPGQGEPLRLDDDRLVPEEVRMAYRVLRNAGLVPDEISQRQEIAKLRAMAVDALSRGDETVHRQARHRLLALTTVLEARGVDVSAPTYDAYADTIAKRVAGEREA